jgi:hypothetical protein
MTETFQPAEDGFARYYAEKLWDWLPEYHRTLDGEGPNPGVLRALVEIVAEQAGHLRRDIDRLWDDQSVELCDDWAVPYLGALLGLDAPQAETARGRRVAVGRAMHYRRRKGTPAVLQLLIAEVAGLEGVAVEAFRRLVRMPHRLDIDAIARGPVTGSPAGGFAELRNPRIAGLTDTGFDEAAHLPDVRRLRGPLGRYGLRKVNLHLFELFARRLSLPTPVQIAPGRWTLDPSGRDVALFQRARGRELPPDALRGVDMPTPILCRRFNAAAHELSLAGLATIDDPALDLALGPMVGRRYRSRAGFLRATAARLTPAQVTAFMPRLLDASLLPESEKAVLWGDSLLLAPAPEAGALPPSAVEAADLSDWGTGMSFASFTALAVDPARGRLLAGPALAAGAAPVAPVGAGSHPRPARSVAPPAVVIPADPATLGPLTPVLPAPLAGHLLFEGSQTVEPVLPPGALFELTGDTLLEGTDGERPYVLFRPESGVLEVRLSALPPADPAETAPSLTIDGLWIGILAAEVLAEVVAPDALATPVPARLILEGRFDRVTLANVTLDPGGERARAAPFAALAIPHVTLEIAGQVRHLEIRNSVTGPIREGLPGLTACNAGRIDVCDSIVQALDPALPAIATRNGRVNLIRSMVLGRVEVAQLYASDSAVAGRVRVADTQNGCFRYSATGLHGGAAVLPAQFEAVLAPGALPDHWIESTRFGDAWFGALSRTAPDAVTRGASNGAAMGAGNARALALRLADLATQAVRHMPVGQTPQYILEREGEETA